MGFHVGQARFELLDSTGGAPSPRPQPFCGVDHSQNTDPALLEGLASVYFASKRALLGFSLTARLELANDHIIVSEVYPVVTATNFGRNRMGTPAGGGPSVNYAEGDSPEFVASLVVSNRAGSISSMPAA